MSEPTKTGKELKLEKKAKKMAQRAQEAAKEGKITENKDPKLNLKNIKIDEAKNNNQKAIESNNTQQVKLNNKKQLETDKNVKTQSNIPLKDIFIKNPNFSKVFALTSYNEIKEENIANNNLNKTNFNNSLTNNKRNASLLNNLNNNHSLNSSNKQSNKDDNFMASNNFNNINKNFNSKDLFILLSYLDLKLNHEEMFLFFLSLGNNKYIDEKESSNTLIKSFVDYVFKLESETMSINFLQYLKRYFEKLIRLIKKLTLVTGGLENTFNYISKLLSEMFTIAKDKSVTELKQIFKLKLDEYMNVRLNKSVNLIVKTGQSLIKKDDCILLYGITLNLKKILKQKVKENLNFSIVYIVNKNNFIDYSNPLSNSNSLDKYEIDNIKFFSELGINVVYSNIVSISSIINKVSKIFLSAKSMLSNGNLVGELGSALISRVAANFKKPVIVFCETFKFWDKIHIDSFHSPNVYFSKNTYKDFELCKLNLNYDLTNANLINMVVCELGYIPPTSVKVIIREYINEEIAF